MPQRQHLSRGTRCTGTLLCGRHSIFDRAVGAGHRAAPATTQGNTGCRICPHRSVCANWLPSPNYAGASSAITKSSSRNSGWDISKAGTGAAFTTMPPWRSPPTDSWCRSGAYFPPPATPRCSKLETYGFPYPVCPQHSRPEALPVRTERHNPHSIATLRRLIATHLARSLPRCPCCLRVYL